MRRLAALVLLLSACGPPPPVTDAPVLLDPIVFSAVPDPAEETGCTSAPTTAARAKHITCEAELAHGPLAMGELGDILLENPHVRFVVRAGDASASTIGGFGGGLLDAERQGGLDRLKELFPLLDLATTRPTEIAIVDAGPDQARVRVLFEADALGLLETVAPGVGRAGPFRGRIDYVLGAEDRALTIEIAVTTEVGVAAQRFLPGAAVLIGGGADVVQPGYGLVEDDRLGGAGAPGLVIEAEDEALGIRLMDELMPITSGSVLSAATIVLVRAERPIVARQGELAVFGVRVAPALLGAEAWNGAHAVTESTLSLRGEPDVRVEIRGADGAPLLRTRMSPSGDVVLRLPPGEYAIASGLRGLFAATPIPITLSAGRVVDLPHLPRGTLRITPSVEGASDVPVRITVLSDAGDEVERFVALGPLDHTLSPGDYQVIVSRGMEFDTHEASVTITDGEVTTLAAALLRAIDTTGFIGADFHLHSEMSTDSRHRVEDALRMVAAEGLELVASTDHDYLTDYGPIAERTGVAAHLVTVVGEEVSSTLYGHLGGYPLRRDVTRSGAGAVVWPDEDVLSALAALRSRGDVAMGGAFVQINHPRLRGTGFFDYLALDPSTGLAMADPVALGLPSDADLDAFDADAVEVWNGYTRGDNEGSFVDWLALRVRGRRLAMLGNSDTHRPELPAGSPRNYLAVPDDSLGAFGWEEAASALRSGDITIAGGLFVTATITGVPVGGVARVRVRIQAPPWAACDRLRIYAGSVVALDTVIAPSAASVRFDETLDVPLAGASFVVVRADGSRAPEPMLHFAPFGITNAIDVP